MRLQLERARVATDRQAKKAAGLIAGLESELEAVRRGAEAALERAEMELEQNESKLQLASAAVLAAQEADESEKELADAALATFEVQSAKIEALERQLAAERGRAVGAVAEAAAEAADEQSKQASRLAIGDAVSERRSRRVRYSLLSARVAHLKQLYLPQPFRRPGPSNGAPVAIPTVGLLSSLPGLIEGRGAGATADPAE